MAAESAGVTLPEGNVLEDSTTDTSRAFAPLEGYDTVADAYATWSGEIEDCDSVEEVTAQYQAITASNPTNLANAYVATLQLANSAVVNETQFKGYDDLATAVSEADAGDEIVLQEDVTLRDELLIAKAITLNGNENTIIGEGPYKVGETGSHAAILVQSANATIENVTVIGPNTRTNQWDEGEYGIHVFGDASSATLENVTVTGANTGIGVFSCEVTLKGNIDVSGNEFGGILVDKGSTQSIAGKLVIEEGAVLINDTEAAYLPTIWCEDENKGSLVEGDQDLYRFDYDHDDNQATGDQLTYYLDRANVPTPSAN